MGSASFINFLSTMYLKPSISKTLSVSLGSSRAMARDGPPHPPSFKKIRIGLTSLLKYSAIFSVADFVISSIIFSFYQNHLYDRTILKPTKTQLRLMDLSIQVWIVKKPNHYPIYCVFKINEMEVQNHHRALPLFRVETINIESSVYSDSQESMKRMLSKMTH